jgi:chromate transporter
MEYIKIFFIFFKIGLFTIGGGLAAIPLLQVEAFSRNWVTPEFFTDMIAVSQSTPGPIGANMATYVGFNELGIAGAIVATLGLICPAVIIVYLISKYLLHFNEKKIVIDVFSGLRPAVAGMILAASYNIAKVTVYKGDIFHSTGNIIEMIDIKNSILFIIFFALISKFDKHPIFFIVLGGIVGNLIL